MIERVTFLDALARLSALMPLQRQYQPEILVAAWDLLPADAKEHLNPPALEFAIKQRLLDQRPNVDKIPLHLALCHYVFPLRDGVPEFAAGLRKDLDVRMKRADYFHDPSIRTEAVKPKLLSGGDRSWHPSMMDDNERRAALEKAIADLQRMYDRGVPQVALRASESAMGERLFAAVVAGFTPLDARTLGASWALRNFEQAMAHLQHALTMITNMTLPDAKTAVAGIIGWQPEQDPGENLTTFEDELGL